MSETATRLFNAVTAVKETAQAIAPGLKNIGVDTKAEVSRLASHGATEGAAALFQGNAFVLYGPGQDPHKWGADQKQDQKAPEPEPQNDQNVQGQEPTQTHGRGR